MTLLTLATAALDGLSGFKVPASFYGSSNPTAKLCVALANEAGKDLEKEHRWQELITEYTFTTTNGTATYALPSGFRAFANMSQWDRTNLWRMRGPTPSFVYQWLKSGISVWGSNNRWFALRGNLFTIYPTPTVTGDTIAFDYYSKLWVSDTSGGAGVYVAAWTADDDTSRLDEDLLTADLKWRFLQANGMPFEPEYKRRESLVEALQADNGGKGMIDLGAPAPQMGVGYGNLPDTGFGS
jgi:hypothetical protein